MEFMAPTLTCSCPGGTPCRFAHSDTFRKNDRMHLLFLKRFPQMDFVVLDDYRGRTLPQPVRCPVSLHRARNRLWHRWWTLSAPFRMQRPHLRRRWNSFPANSWTSFLRSMFFRTISNLLHLLGAISTSLNLACEARSISLRPLARSDWQGAGISRARLRTGASKMKNFVS
jgi:hypothetical protein